MAQVRASAAIRSGSLLADASLPAHSSSADLLLKSCLHLGRGAGPAALHARLRSPPRGTGQMEPPQLVRAPTAHFRTCPSIPGVTGSPPCGAADHTVVGASHTVVGCVWMAGRTEATLRATGGRQEAARRGRIQFWWCSGAEANSGEAPVARDSETEQRTKRGNFLA
ncbi:unnamed protein product [Urochloa humidicola]